MGERMRVWVRFEFAERSRPDGRTNAGTLVLAPDSSSTPARPFCILPVFQTPSGSTPLSAIPTIPCFISSIKSPSSPLPQLLSAIYYCSMTAWSARKKYSGSCSDATAT